MNWTGPSEKIHLYEFAHRILLGNTLSEKLLTGDIVEGPEKNSSFLILDPLKIPHFPGRPPGLDRPGKAKFPDLSQIASPTVRGQILHFFANHELLALELMALMLLRFPQAPSAFKMGVVKTIQEEQNHLRLYLQRMKTLGVEFGDLPVSDYFWKAIRLMESPLDFVVRMSLTLEQANLDFSLFYRNEAEKAGDLETASILEQVYREEIGHVKHGLHWFNRWRENPEAESDWTAYLRHLKPPMTPRRGKGDIFDEAGRRSAGFSETFIQEMKNVSGSKGRPPTVWFFNPHCDAENARQKPGFTPTQNSQHFRQDLEHLPMFLSLESDIVFLKKRPPLPWLEFMKSAGFSLPEFNESNLAKIQALHCGGAQPWGWSPDAFEFFKPLLPKMVHTPGSNAEWAKNLLQRAHFSQTGLQHFFSKAWSTQFLKEWKAKQSPEVLAKFGPTFSTGDVALDETAIFKEILSSHSPWMIKAPYGTSGMQNKRVDGGMLPSEATQGWIRNVLQKQNGLIIEPYLNKIMDLSIQIEVAPHQIKIHDVRTFFTGAQHEYKGTLLGAPLPENSPNFARFLHTSLQSWHLLLRDLGTELRSGGYLGPAGIDALIFTDHQNQLCLKPLVELNPRWTMGRIALALENHLPPGTRGIWAFCSRRQIEGRGFSSIKEFSTYLQRRFPPRVSTFGNRTRLTDGVLFTNPPETAQEVLTFLMAQPSPEIFDLLT